MSQLSIDLKGRTALVCGSSKGIGRGVAESFAKAGADVILCSRNVHDLYQLKDQLHAQYGVRVDVAPSDLSHADGVSLLVDSVKSRSIDILLNNVAGPSPSSASDTTEAAWRSGFEQLFLSSTLLTQALLPGMKARRYGRMITVTSLSVVEPIDHLAVSTSMRAAVTAYAKSLAKEVAPFGITVHTLMPGIIYTDRIVNLRKAAAARLGTTLEMELEKTLSGIPMGRFGVPEDVGHLAAFLASPLASFLTGLNLNVDGGQRKGWT
jgi:3-oxoacyl-[acyl-carrier protein] reductase